MGAVGRFRSSCNTDPGQVVAHDKGMAGSVVMVKHLRIFDLTPDAVDPLFKYFEDVQVKHRFDGLTWWYKLGMEYIATSTALPNRDSLYCTPSRTQCSEQTAASCAGFSKPPATIPSGKNVMQRILVSER